MIYVLLDWFFMVFHSILIVFNLFGWIWRSLRKANLVTLLLTGLSWVGLGLFYGIGYCPLTDWHWEVLYKLGTPPQTPSYIAYLFDRMLGINLSSHLADQITSLSYTIALILSLTFNFNNRFKRIKS